MHRRIMIMVVLICMLMFLITCDKNSEAPTGPPDENYYYVSPGGADTNNGAESTPWRTIQHGINSIEPGQTLIITDGSYNEAVIINKSGTESKAIIIKSINRNATITGKNLSKTQGITLQNGVSSVRIEGLIIKEFKSWGMYLAGNNNNIELAFLKIEHCQDSAIRIDSGTHLKLSDSVMEHNRGAGLDCIACDDIQVIQNSALQNTGDDWMDGFAFERESRNILVQNSTADGNSGDGIDSKGDNTRVVGCTARNCTREGIKLWGKNSSIESCLSENNGRAGVVLKDGGDYSVEKNIIRNNGFSGNDYAMYAAYDNEAPTKVRMSYNTIYNNYGAVHFGKVVSIESEDYDNFYNRQDCEIYWGKTSRECYTRTDLNNKTWFNETGFGQHTTSTPP